MNPSHFTGTPAADYPILTIFKHSHLPFQIML
nr:MAG TPA: hypothetical protein [Caudoviricetes sp.]